MGVSERHSSLQAHTPHAVHVQISGRSFTGHELAVSGNSGLVGCKRNGLSAGAEC